jgi:excisionase family DNA binding protein
MDQDRPTLRNLSSLPPTLTVGEAADLLSISRSAAYRAAARGELPVLRLGERTVRVLTWKLLELLGVDRDEAPT